MAAGVGATLRGLAGWLVSVCWLALNAVPERGVMPPCQGRLVRVHLIPRQLLERELGRGGAAARRAIADERSWVWGCGGPMGNAGHHGMLDAGHRPLRVPRLSLPAGLEELADELGLGWWLEREYGPLPAPRSRS